MMRGFMMWNLVVYRVILMCTRFASGCHIGELEHGHVVRVHAQFATHSFADANLPSQPQPSPLSGDMTSCLVNEVTVHCLAGLTAVATPTSCAQSAESMVPDSVSTIRLPMRDRNVDDGLCSALLSPKPTSTVHGTAGVLGNAFWAMCMRCGQVVRALMARFPWLSVLMPAVWSTSALGHFGRFVHGVWCISDA